MSNRVQNVAIIDLRNLDGVILEGESDKENGGDGRRSAKGPSVEDILKSHEKAMHRWNTLFIIVCAFAVFIDPLFCYILVVMEDYMCFNYDMKLVVAYFVLRTACDVFYIIDIIIFFCGIYKKGKGNIFGACRKPRSKKNTLPSLKKVIRKRYHLLFSVLPRILVSLPIPAVLFGFSCATYFDPFYGIIIITPFQYTQRIFLIYGSQRWRPIKRTTTGRWLKPLLDFLPFILASHLFGALWYRLAVQRQMDCWKLQCEEVRGEPCTSIAQLECPFDDVYNDILEWNLARVQELCPTRDADPKVFDFGIFTYAVTVTGSSHTSSQRISQSFWWALRNLSSFGSNLSTSMDTLEIFFSVAISICGMVLFLVYLNARVQESQAKTNQLKLTEKKHLMKPDIDLWLFKHNLSNVKRMTKDSNKDLKKMMKKKKALKTVIIENMVKLEENKDIDLQNIVSILPVKFRKSLIRLLCLASLKKVPILANLNDKMLKVICEHLKPVVYSEGNYIVEEGKPLGMMLFITQGFAWSYTTKNINGVTSFDSSINEWLKQGDYYGEELLNWAFKSPSFSALPICTRTVMSQEKVEAFALRASDLRNIVRKFWWHFTRELEQVDLEQWENLAASSIQGAWRNRLAKARRSNRWDKFFCCNY